MIGIMTSLDEELIQATNLSMNWKLLQFTSSLFPFQNFLLSFEASSVQCKLRNITASINHEFHLKSEIIYTTPPFKQKQKLNNSQQNQDDPEMIPKILPINTKRTNPTSLQNQKITT